MYEKNHFKNIYIIICYKFIIILIVIVFLYLVQLDEIVVCFKTILISFIGIHINVLLTSLSIKKTEIICL